MSSVLRPDGTLDPARLAAFVAWAEPCIRDWPPRLTGSDHQAQVLDSTRRVVEELDAVPVSAITDQRTLTNIAYSLAMAHNLDLPTSLKAKQAFERAIAINPNDRRANYLFGMFLISTKAYHFDSLPYLQKAYALGEEDALFSIGLLLVRKDEKAKGLEALEKYAKVRPESVQTRRVIEGIKNGTLTFHETANPPINAKR